MAQKSDIPLIDPFKDWLAGSVTSPVVANYSSWLRKIECEFICTLNTGSKESPLTILDKYLIKVTKSGPNKRFVEELLLAIQSNINKRRQEIAQFSPGTLNEFSCERSAFNSYNRFILEYIDERNHCDRELSRTQVALVKILYGDKIVFSRNELTYIFASRIKSQDRNTGDKTFFPLGLIARILDRGVVAKWADKEAENVIIHTQTGHVKVSDMKEMIIDTVTQQVRIILKDKREEIVYNPCINGKKDPMLIRQIKDTDLDHEPEIHAILHNMKGSLPGLDQLTDLIRKKQQDLGYKTINSKNYDKICNALYDDIKGTVTDKMKQDLEQELDKVSSNHILQLASADWNRSAKKQAKKQHTKNK